MIGAIVGDIAGSRFEFDNHKSKDFELFVSCGKLNGVADEVLETMLNSSTFSDDSVMTLAIAKAILLWKEMKSSTYQDLSRLAEASMREFGKIYPLAGYGGTIHVIGITIPSMPETSDLKEMYRIFQKQMGDCEKEFLNYVESPDKR